MSLSILNAQAVSFLQEGRPHEGVSLLLEAFERMDFLAKVGEENQSHSSKSTTLAGSQQRSDKYSPDNQYSKEFGSACSETSRYQEAVSRAMEAHLRLSQSRSMESNCQSNPGLTSVDSDVSDISEATGGGELTLVTEIALSADGSEDHETEMGTRSTEELAEEEGSTGSSDSAQTTSLLQSIALPDFHDSTQAPDDDRVPTSDNMFTFYQRAFILHGDDVEDSPKHCAVLLYNMAVAHHNYAMSSRHHDRVASHREFRTALVFYDMCFNIIHDSWADDEDFLLLLLAVWNNMGHIHAHRYNYLETQEMLTSLQEILEVISNSSLLENPDFLFFYQNLVVYEEQEFAAAPAA